MARRVFISYRRDDTAGHAGRLYDHLCQRFDKENVFKDVEAISPGREWARAIEKAIDGSTVLLAVIGREWLNARDPRGGRRLDAPDDILRREIASGLAHAALVVPVLVNGARIPVPDELPEDLRPLVKRHAVELRDERWDADVEDLVRRALTEVPPRPDPRPWRARTIGAVTAGLLVAMVAAGFIAEGSYARLLGLDFVVPPGSAPVLSGAQFLIDLATTLLRIAAGGLVVVLLGTALTAALKRIFPRWSPGTLLRAVRSRAGALVAAQVMAGIGFVVFSLAAFADLMPLAALPSRSGITSAPLDLIARGPGLYRTAVVSVLAVCLTQAALEYWRHHVGRSGLLQGSWAKLLSLLLSIPLDLICFIELLLLPVGHGLLKLPSSRQHTATVVTFKETVANADLRGRTFLLLPLRQGSGARAFFCPDPPRTLQDIGEDQLAYTRTTRTGTILQLAAEFAKRERCAAEDLQAPPALSARSQE